MFRLKVQLMRRSILIAFFTVLVTAVASFAQAPLNDDCSDASEITFGAGNFGTGLFSSDTFNITNAGTQTGELFHASMTSAGNDDKSIWFKFTLPTKRGIKIELKQPRNSIISTDVGFTTYRSGSCFPPLSAVSAAYITPLTQFGSSFHPCMEPGEYFVQVSSKGRASGIVQLEITVTYPDEHPSVSNSEYDKPDSASVLGVISDQQQIVDFETGCYSIEDTSEWCQSIDTAYKRYIQSSWHTFTTAYRLDVLEVLLGPAPGETFSQGTIVGYNLYKGDVRNSSFNSLQRIDSCHRFYFNRLVNTANDPLVKEYICALEASTTYSIQLLYRDDFAKNVRLNVRSITADSAVRAPVPIRSSMHPGNLLGKLPIADTIVTSRFNDYFSCESRLSNTSNQCGTVNPSGGIRYGGITYGLSSWFEFELDEAANVQIAFPFDASNSPCHEWLAGRVFNDTITGNCNALDTMNVISWFTEADPALIPCLQPGKYAIQILGVDQSSYQFCDVGRHLGRNVQLEIRTIRGRAEHKFSLKNNRAVDSLNASSGALQPLKLGQTYSSIRDTLGCLRTALPSRGVCGQKITKGVYRIFEIGDADNDNVPDSGMVIVKQFSALPPMNLDYRLYRGDASALAQQQSAFSYPDTISGLLPLTDCFSADLTINTKAYCLTPGTYTLATFGGDRHVGAHDAPQISFEKTVTKFYDPSRPERLDTLRGTVASKMDYFSCYDNPATIDGVAPCKNFTKLIYRQFYLPKASFLNIFLTTGHQGTFSLFKGRATDGLNTLKVYQDQSGSWVCFTNKRSTDCSPVPEGWYTLVAYSNGPSYDTTQSQFGTKGNIGAPNSAVFFFLPEPPRPKYNRPQKAYYADSLLNNGNPLDFSANLGSTANPQHKKTYILGQETFDCYPDTPFSVHPITPCDTIYNRFVYYVFGVSKPSHVKISSIAATHQIRVYDFDARKHPQWLNSRQPIQQCYRDPRFAEICMLDSGTYTLVIMARDLHLNRSVQPRITVDTVGISRFDFAANAYDFGVIQGDSTYKNSKKGDVHPQDPSLPPSADVFYCTTGASKDDPYISCNGSYNPGVYSSKRNNALWNHDSITPNVIRRNIWYTFVLKGTGNATVKLNNLSQSLPYVSPFAVYASDVNAKIPFDSLRKNGGIDSTIQDGLVEVARNYRSNCNNSFTASFKKELCDTFFERRYYVQLGLYAQNLFKAIDPIAQFSLEVLYDSVALPPLRFDHYSQANLINGMNESEAPYTQVSLKGQQIYKGFPGTFKSAGIDSTDQAPSCASGNLWYKIMVDTSGKLYMNYLVNGDTNLAFNRFGDSVINLFRVVNPGDSTINGLSKVSWTSAFINSSNSYWARACVAPGEYYLTMNNCGLACSDIITPVVQLDFDPGDQCGMPSIIMLSSGKTSQGDVVVDCHTIGEGFGEDGSNMGCLFGPSGYKSSWFKLDYSDTTKVDLLFELLENTTAQAADIRYRVLYGDCSYLSVGPCNSSSLTQFELKCMQQGTYFIQIVSPENTLGTISLRVSAVPATDTTCVPINPFKPFANFDYDIRCSDNQVVFSNLSSRGDSIVYDWSFGNNNDTDTSFEPVYHYPLLKAPQSYSARLIVRNIAKQTTDTLIKTILAYHKPDPWLNRDTTVCPGSPVLVSGKPYGASGVRWFDNDTSSQRTFTIPDVYTVAALVDTCLFYDSITIKNYIHPVLELGPDLEICDEDTARIAAPDTFVTYRWNTNATDSVITSFTAGQFRLEVIDANGCKDSDTIELTVNALPDASLQSAGPYCVSETDKTINPSVNTGGLFSGNYVNPTGTFSPERAGPGLHKVYYTYTDSKSCTRRDSTAIRVHPLPDASISNVGPYCSNDNKVQLSGRVNAGGDFSGGSFVTASGQFDPKVAAAGLHKVYYSFTDNNGCSNVDSTEIRVNGLPDASLLSFGPYCRDHDTVHLRAATNQGGTYSGGNFVNNSGVFNPAIAGPGLHTLYYRYTDANNCTNRDSSTIRVNDLPNAAISPTTAVCEDVDTVVILPLANRGGRFYGGQLIDSSGHFFAKQSGPGVHKFYYEFTDQNGCSNTDSTTQEVHALPDASLQPLGPFCIDAGDYYVLPVVNQGGRFFGGSFISQTGLFQTEIAGVGDHTIHYTFTDSKGCTSVDSTMITVNPLPDASVVPSGPWCIDSGVQTLSARVNSGGRFFGGNFVSNSGDFDPELAGDGLHKVYYEFTDNNVCYNRDSISIRVNPLPDASITQVGPYCVDHLPVQLTGDQNRGGEFSGGTYVTMAGTFSPALADSGMHSVYYTFTDANGCINTDSIQIRVNALPDASITPFDPICIDEGIQQLTPLNTSGGRFFGNSFTDYTGSFDPRIAGIGIHKVWYDLTDANGCYNIDSTELTINALPDASIAPAGPWCVSAGLMKVNAQTNLGGTFYGGTYVDSSGNFDTRLSDVGLHTVAYEITDNNGCYSNDTIEVRVHALPDAAIRNAGPYCEDDPTDQLEAVINNGGVFSGGTFVSQSGQFYPIQAGPGMHKVYYEFTDINGCYSMDSTEIRVHLLPNPAFTADLTEGCTVLPVTFTGPEGMQSYQWEFSNGEQGNSQQITIGFPTGTWTANLEVRDQNGCVNSMSRSNYITVHPLPVSLFDFSPKELFIKSPL
jgi:hypothetical protein